MMWCRPAIEATSRRARTPSTTLATASWSSTTTILRSSRCSFFIWQTLPDPPWETTYDQLARPWDKAVIVAGPEEDWGVLQHDGRRLRGDILGTGLLEALAEPGLLWANAVEPWAMQGGDPLLADARPIAIAVDSATSTLVDTVRLAPDGRSLLGGKDRGIPTVTTPAAAARRPGPAAPDGIVVYSRLLGEVWLVGGGEQSAEPSGTARWTLLDGDGDLVERGLSQPLGRVLAATIATADGRLWVLDEVPAVPRPALRLLRIDRDLGDVEVVAVSRAARHFERYGMSLDQEGRVLLQGSRGGEGTSKGEHLVLRVQVVDGALSARRVAHGQGALALPIIAQERDAIFWLRKRGDVSAVRVQSLQGPALPQGGLEAAL
jgi:hypothetical protein